MPPMPAAPSPPHASGPGAEACCEGCGGSDSEFLFLKDGYTVQRCPACRLIRIHPQPDEAALARIYGESYFSKAWGVQTDPRRVLALKQATFRRHVLPAVALAPGARILDCGAAFGALMAAAEERGWQAYGIELAPEAAAAIARRFGPERVFSGPFEQAAFPSLTAEAFDAVFMCDFIEHVRDPAAVMAKACRLLRPGGTLVLTTPDGDSLSRRLMGSSWPHFKVEHLFTFSRRNLAPLLQRSGFARMTSRPARKVLDLDYLQHQFNTYPRRLITPLLNALARCAGNRLRHHPLSFSFGEILVTATKV
jgi:2-polyprenyl-3-methyl-5-hydroxy-6-metoxy-1,4-benzoquinol methylase